MSQYKNPTGKEKKPVRSKPSLLNSSQLVPHKVFSGGWFGVLVEYNDIRNLVLGDLKIARLW